jgi:maleate cis-trans isomerase
MHYFLPNISGIDIRNQICDYLEQNGKIIEGVSTQEVLSMENNDYIQEMRKTTTMGGAIEIQAACNVWNLKIIVKNDRDENGRIIEFIPLNGIDIKKTIQLQWTGGHYEPIRN